MNFFNQGIPLGRWFRITVIVHWTFLLYVAQALFSDGGEGGSQIPLPEHLGYLGLLFGIVLVHEFGHALSCRAMGGQADHIVLWPLGGIAFVQPPMNPTAWLVSTVCGPLVNAILWPVSYFALRFWFIHANDIFAWQAFLHDVLPDMHKGITIFDPSLPIGMQALFLSWQINKMLLLFNLIPAYPMDGGRILQELLWFALGYGRSMMIAGMVGTVAGAGFVVLGLGIWSLDVPALDFHIGGEFSYILIIIGALCAMQSFAIYTRAHEIKGWRKN